MTNGEKLCIDFPDMHYTLSAEQTRRVVTTIGVCASFDLEWWNAEYKEPTTKNDLAQERYQDLIEYFGSKEVAKAILGSRKEFKAWLERLRWNVKRANELARELEQIQRPNKNDLGVETTTMIDKSNFSQEQYKADLQSAYDCGYAQAKNDLGVDCISRQALYDALYERFHEEDTNNITNVTLGSVRNFVKDFPSVTPQPRKGYWIKYEKKYMTEKRLTPVTHFIRECSVCHTKFADFYGKMNFCPNCGSRNEVEE